MYTLIGCPLGHSMSPWIHARLFRLSGKTADYTLTEIPTPELAAKMPELRRMKGFNITIPHKVDIIPLLDALDETAERYQSVNCVRNADGKAVGYNTDCTGFLRSVEGMQLGGKVLLIGSGGVGRMMATEAVLHGAELTIVEKDIPRAEALAQELTRLGGSVRVREQAPEEPFDLLMNASPVGMYPKTNACPVDEAVIRRSAAVFDVIYNPTETKLLQTAKRFGIPAVGGAAMLVWQAVRAHEIWDGDSYDPQDIAVIIRDMEQEVDRLFPAGEAAK